MSKLINVASFKYRADTSSPWQELVLTGDVSALADIVGDVEDLKTSLSDVKSDIGIVEDGNTATHAIAKGQYVVWKGSLYTASSAITVGTTLSSSNLTAVSNGGLNAFQADKPLFRRIKTGRVSFTAASTGDSRKTVTFDEPYPDTGYYVIWQPQEVHWNHYFDGPPNTENYSATGFTAVANVISANSYTWNARWFAFYIG